jgi:hypothetical protein
MTAAPAALQSAATASHGNPLLAGVLLVTGGLALITLGSGWVLDYGGLTSTFYRRVIRGWDHFGAGRFYKRSFPPRQFRYGGGLAIAVMGLVLFGLGVVALAT